MSTNPVHIGQLQRANGNAQHAVIAATQHLPAPSVVETAGAVLAAQAKALVEARFIMAMQRPRDLDAVRQKLLKECQRPGFADEAIYHKPIGDGIEGLSIRFAEAAIRCMTNVSVTVQTIYDDREKRIVRVAVEDLESTVPYSKDITIQKTVERRRKKETDVVHGERLNSKGDRVYIIEATDDEILNKENALVSKALREQALRLVPGDIKAECMQVCYRVLDDKAAKDPDAERRRIFDSFGTIGISVNQLKEYLGHNGESLTPKELQTLRGLYAALKEGETTWLEIMDNREPRKTEPQAAAPKQPSKPPLENFEQQGQTATQQQAGPEPENARAPANDQPPSFEELIGQINAAKTPEAIDIVLDLIRSSPENGRDALMNIAQNKRARIVERSQPSAAEPKAQKEAAPRRARSRMYE